MQSETFSLSIRLLNIQVLHSSFFRLYLILIEYQYNLSIDEMDTVYEKTVPFNQSATKAPDY